MIKNLVYSFLLTSFLLTAERSHSASMHSVPAGTVLRAVSDILIPANSDKLVLFNETSAASGEPSIKKDKNVKASKVLPTQRICEIYFAATSRAREIRAGQPFEVTSVRSYPNKTLAPVLELADIENPSSAIGLSCYTLVSRWEKYWHESYCKPYYKPIYKYKWGAGYYKQVGRKKVGEDCSEGDKPGYDTRVLSDRLDVDFQSAKQMLRGYFQIEPAAPSPF